MDKLDPVFNMKTTEFLGSEKSENYLSETETMQQTLRIFPLAEF